MSLRPSIPRSLASCPPSLAEHASLLSKRSYISTHLSIPPGVSTTWQSLGHHRVISLRKFWTWQSLGHHWCEPHEVDVVVPQKNTWKLHAAGSRGGVF